MRELTFPGFIGPARILLAVILVAVGCDKQIIEPANNKANNGAPKKTDPLYKTIDPGKVEYIYALEGPMIKGSFTVNPGSERSQGTGGACLVADMHDFGKPSPIPEGGCADNYDCQRSLESGWVGYCERTKRECWVRPGPAEQFCNRSADHNFKPWDVGVKNPTPITPLKIPRLSRKSINWRVVACLNRIPEGKTVDSKDCGTGGPDKVELFGDPIPVFYTPIPTPSPRRERINE